MAGMASTRYLGPIEPVVKNENELPLGPGTGSVVGRLGGGSAMGKGLRVLWTTTCLDPFRNST